MTTSSTASSKTRRRSGEGVTSLADLSSHVTPTMTAHLLREGAGVDLGEGDSTLLHALYSKQGREWFLLCCKEGFWEGPYFVRPCLL